MDDAEVSDFLKASIVDTQGTIRALDTKIAGLIALLIFPLANINKICSNIYNIFKSAETNFATLVFVVFVSLFCLVWLASFWVALFGILGIHNPAVHVKADTKKYLGIFYLGGAFSPTWIDAAFNRDNQKSKQAVTELLSDLKKGDASFNEELMFEKIKLTYIRDFKMIRHKSSFYLAILWLMLGLSIYLTSFAFKIKAL